MATKGHKWGQIKDLKQMRKEKRDKYIEEI
jgi:hypothetical protein